VSEDNVEIVRGIARAIGRGDVDYVIRHTTEDCVLLVARSAVDGPFLGHEGVRRFFASNEESFEVFEIHEHEVRALGADRVLSLGSVHVRGRGGGVETDIPYAGVTTFQDGRATRWEDFRERRLALEAAGLET
jgi:ketosteroid isomerase-like protein